MTLGKMVAVVAGIAFGCGALGGLLGYLVGTLEPGYYRTVFDHVEGDPAHLGVVLGITQGLPSGVALGILLIVLSIWRESKIRK